MPVRSPFALRLGCRLLAALALAPGLAPPAAAGLEQRRRVCRMGEGGARQPAGRDPLPRGARAAAGRAHRGRAARAGGGCGAARGRSGPRARGAGARARHARARLHRPRRPRRPGVGERVAILHRRFIGGTGENLAEHQGIPIDQLADADRAAGAQAGRRLAGEPGPPQEPAGARLHALRARRRRPRRPAGHGPGLRPAQRAARRAAAARGPAGRRAPLAIAAGDGAAEVRLRAAGHAARGAGHARAVVQRGRRSRPAIPPQVLLPGRARGLLQIVDGPLLVVR